MATADDGRADLAQSGGRMRATTWIAVAAAAVVVIGGIGLGVALSTGSSHSDAGSGTGGHPLTASSARSTPTTPPPALSVDSVRPSADDQHVSPGTTIAVAFSAPLAADAERPTLDPPVAGTWTERGARLVFRPVGGFVPSTKETVTVPSGEPAVEGGHIVRLAAKYTATFQVEQGSYRRLSQLLAELKYLPFTFTPSAVTTAFVRRAEPTTGHPPTTTTTVPAASTTTAPATTTTTARSTTTTVPATTTSTAPPTTAAPSTAPSTTAPRAATTTTVPAHPTTTTTAPAPAPATSGLGSEPHQAGAVSTVPQQGTLAWAYPDIPPSLSALWTPGANNTIIRGAVMAFESDHGLTIDGIAGPEVWTALLQAVAARDVDPRPYNYIQVTENLPETLTVWQDGKIVVSSPANTGVPGAATALGTYPIYTHLATTIMKGQDVDGTEYDEPVQWVGYFQDGDAVHGYVRPGYGYPQSNGCVELPEATAEAMFNSDENYYGVLVTVTAPT